MSSPKLGEGIFLVSDVANILDLPVRTVRSWLLEFWDKRFAETYGEYSMGTGRDRAVNFYTLIEFITFAKLRQEGFSAQRIQKFHNHLSTILKTGYPFAKTKLLSDKRNVWYTYLDELIKFDGKYQYSFKKILGPFLNKIEFDEEDIATRYFPLGKSNNVVIDPKHQFGRATIVGTNIKAETIYSLYKGNEPKKSICILYNLSLKQVNDAISYCEGIAA